MQNVDNVLSNDNSLTDFLNSLTLFALNDNLLTLNTSLNRLMLNDTLNGLTLNALNVLCLFIDKGLKVVRSVGRGACVIKSLHTYTQTFKHCIKIVESLALRFRGLVLLLAHFLCQYRDSYLLDDAIAWSTSDILRVVNATVTDTYLLPALMTHPHPLNFTDQPYIHPTVIQPTFSTSIRDCLKVQHTIKDNNNDR